MSIKNALHAVRAKGTLTGSLVLGTALALAGCGQAPADVAEAGDRTQEGGGWYGNGGGWYGNGGGWYGNGGGWYGNGGGWYGNGGTIFFDSGGGIPNGGGAGANGLPASQAQGLGVDNKYGQLSRAYRGIGWNQGSQSWTGVAWGGWSNPVDCAATGAAAGVLSTGSDQACTTLHNPMNHTDVDGDGIVGTKQDKNMRLVALGHWVGCACPSTVSIPFKDADGLLPNGTTFNGGMGFAPTWCGSDVNALVPKAEIERVSGCMLALQNTSWKHYNLSLRSTAGTGATSPNETLLATSNAARYWGNLWKDPHTDTDTTTCDPEVVAGCTDPTEQGGAWYNKERFSCQVFAGGGVQNYGLQDQWVFGRECELSRCGGGVEFLGFCKPNNKRLATAADPSEYAHVINGKTYYEAKDVELLQAPASAGGLSLSYANDAWGVSSLSSASYRGDSTAAIDVWTPSSISLEDPLPNPIPNTGTLAAGQPNPWWYGTGWAQVDFGTPQLPSWQSGDCGNGMYECQGNSQLSAYRKLYGLNSSQWLTINYTGWRPQLGSGNLVGDGYQPVTMAIRYQRPGVLGHGQCDPVYGCGGTQASDCASGTVGSSGACSGGSGSSGKLDVYIMGTVAGSTTWTQVHGPGTSGKNMFPATGVRGGYNTAYVYPVYPQNSYNTIGGLPSQWAKPAGNTTADTLRAAIHGTTASTSDAPQLDTAYFSPGMPSPDMDCTTSAGCWIYAGPNQFVSLAAGSTKWINLGTAGWYTSPTLPAGTYTFQIKNVYGDLDLYVKANSLVDMGNYDCRSTGGRNAEELCTITLSKPGYLSVLVYGYANQYCNSSGASGCTCANNVSGCAATGTVVGHNGSNLVLNGGLVLQ